MKDTELKRNRTVVSDVLSLEGSFEMEEVQRQFLRLLQ